MVIDKYVTRMHNNITIHRDGLKTVLRNEDDSILAVLKDIKHNINRGGADTETYRLLDTTPIYTINDSENIFFATEDIGTEKYNDEESVSLIDKVNTILSSNEQLHEWLLKNDDKYTMCFHSKIDHEGIFRLVLVYAIDKESEKIVHPKNIDNIDELSDYFLFMDLDNSLGSSTKSLTGYHFYVTKGMELLENELYKKYKWVTENPKNKKRIIEDFFDEHFVVKCPIFIDEVNHVFYDEEFIITMNEMKHNYIKMLEKLVAIDTGIARLYTGNKPDNVLALETNNLFIKYGFIFMVNRRYIDIKYMKTLLVSSIKKMETFI